MSTSAEQLRAIKTFPSLVKYLREELEWPIESGDFDDLTFEYLPEELGLDPKTAAKIKEIKQLRPLTGNQPWGIFFINFEPKSLPVIALRRILSHLVIKKRKTSNQSERPAWAPHDLLFISSYGEDDHRDITFAQFSDDATDLPSLRVLSWDDEDTAAHLVHAHDTLKGQLRWPDNPADLTSWRKSWASAFTLKPREVVNTSKALAVRLAELATVIRKRVNKILEIESEKGPLRTLHASFKEALIHDLKEDDFADMYAQTITYGLLSARVSRPAGLVAENIADMVPVTNPFLRDLLSTFLTIGGRKGKIDFDEVGINEVVQVLRDANMEAVLRDFGDRNPQEDPVVHFYELFLKEYDPKKRMQRGVFYTPRPVVSYIVRSVDEILRKEFGLADGLADRATWGQMVKSHPEMKIPEGARSEDTFVQILDPATGTGTFLVEVIDCIYKTMTVKWQGEGHNQDVIQRKWNEYVPDNLLPRLYGFELMMAPYAVAHMKIGLKLHDTGYDFKSHERARIYLTNTLEPAHGFSGQLELDAPALAHEAQAVNEIKTHKRFTVVIGNPPYSGISSNMTIYAQRIVDAYKIVDGVALNERKLWLQDDYVKFIRNAQTTINSTNVGVFGYITNHGYLDNPTFRGMRQNLMGTFTCLRILDLHGNTNKKEQSPDGFEDNNVFDIRQGVAICLATCGGAETGVLHSDIWGSRESKYAWLTKFCVSETPFLTLTPDSPFYFFEPQNTDFRAEYDVGWKISDAMPVNCAGFVTARDHFVIALDKKTLLERIGDFANLNNSDAEIRVRYFDGCGSARYPDGDTRGWKVPVARRCVAKDKKWRERVRACLYRPFDPRPIYWADWMVDWPRSEVMRHMLDEHALALSTSRSVEIGSFEHVLCADLPLGHHTVSLKEVNYMFPLYLLPDGDAQQSLALSPEHKPNFMPAFLKAVSVRLSLPQKGAHGLPANLTPENIFHYIYAILHSPGYRSRYAAFLKIDFPRLPLTGNLVLFRALAVLGGELVALHLLKSAKLDEPITKWKGLTPSSEVEKITYSDETVWIDKAKTVGFERVPEPVWSFHIGGYQVCQKWLKDRKGRKLSKEDITHYQKIVVALNETIRLMKEIDEVIETHGGWPGVFVNKSVEERPMK